MPDQWYVARNDKKHGPFTGAKLKKLAAQGRLLPTDMLLNEGSQKWVAASSVKGLFPAQPSNEELKDEREQATTASAPANPVAWVQEQLRTNPQRVLLAGGGAALGLVFLLCLGCTGLVSLMSGGGSSPGKFGGESRSHASRSLDRSDDKQLIVGKWRDEAGLTVVEYTEDGKYILTVSGHRIDWRYAFRDNETVEITKGKGNVTLTVSVDGDTLTETDDKGTVVKYSRVGAAKKKRTDVGECKKLIVGKWKQAGEDLGLLGEVIDEYTADGRIVVWDTKDSAVAGRGKYHFIDDDKVKISLEGHNYTATISISGDKMTVTDEDGKSSTHRRVK